MVTNAPHRNTPEKLRLPVPQTRRPGASVRFHHAFIPPHPALLCFCFGHALFSFCHVSSLIFVLFCSVTVNRQKGIPLVKEKKDAQRRKVESDPLILGHAAGKDAKDARPKQVGY